MRTFAILLAAAVVAIPASADARPRKRGGFATQVTFRACSTSTAFACGKPDGAGGTYGTAHQRTRCTTLTFAPDGTVRIEDMDVSSGRYVRRGDRVIITRPDEPTWELELSADGTDLDGFHRVGP